MVPTHKKNRIWMLIMLSIFISALFYSVKPQASESLKCGVVDSNIKLKSFLDLVQISLDMQIAPLDVQIKKYPVLLVMPNSEPQCATLLFQDKISRLELEKPFEVEGWTAKTWMPKTPYNKLSPSNEDLLATLNVDGLQTLFLLNLDSKYPDFYDGTAGSLRSHFGLVVHEGFHIFLQGNRFSSPKCVDKSQACPPNWSFDQPIQFLRETCYNKNPKIQQLLADELSALKSAFRLASMANNVSESKAALKSFVQFREERYALLKKDLFGEGLWERAVSCAEIESEMEWLEGGAKFIDVIYLLKLNLISGEELLSKNFSGAYHESPNYISGMLQLMLLQSVDANFDDFVSIFRSPQTPSSELQFGRLKQILNY